MKPPALAGMLDLASAVLAVSRALQDAIDSAPDAEAEALVAGIRLRSELESAGYDFQEPEA